MKDAPELAVAALRLTLAMKMMEGKAGDMIPEEDKIRNIAMFKWGVSILAWALGEDFNWKAVEDAPEDIKAQMGGFGEVLKELEKAFPIDKVIEVAEKHRDTTPDMGDWIENWQKRFGR